ncbi:MAG: biotin--[acetyl-CoA-carboxylase] ligase [Chloroflexi bacterium]|nr:biotin--[acetyl-CoA-carboxylase] ligase [Chloroflexota bacterium]
MSDPFPSGPFVTRLERYPSVPSTQPIVRGWLEDGAPEVLVAVADEQTDGRGRLGRTWTAPIGAALLVSVGFRPVGLAASHAWRLGATAALAMLDAAEDVAGLRDGTLGLKWPNDIVADGPDGLLRKVAGVLGEATLDDDRVDTAVIGLGVNADWPLELFPADLAPSMTSLRELSGGRPIDRDTLLDAWLDRLEPRYEALRGGHFDAGGWSSRQRTTGHQVEVDGPGGRTVAQALGVDPESGALLVAGPDGAPRPIDAGDVTRCRVVALPGLARRV